MINTIFVSDMKEALLIFHVDSREQLEELAGDISGAKFPCRWMILDKSADITLIAGKPVDLLYQVNSKDIL